MNKSDLGSDVSGLCGRLRRWRVAVGCEDLLWLLQEIEDCPQCWRCGCRLRHYLSGPSEGLPTRASDFLKRSAIDPRRLFGYGIVGCGKGGIAVVGLAGNRILRSPEWRSLSKNRLRTD